MKFSLEKFTETKTAAETFYADIGNVRCPYFNEDISFNAKGLDHLIFKSWNNTRPVQDQFARFRHIELAPEILKLSKTVQGIWTTKKFERVKKNNGTWEQILKVVTYYEFIAVMDSHGSKVRVKVIVKQVEGGSKFFFSIIPFWGTNTQGERVLHSGNPELD